MAGKRKNNRAVRIDRNKMVGPMGPFERVDNPEGADELEIIATFQNNKFGVFLKKMLSDGFSVPGPDGRPRPMEILHLVIFRHDKKKIEIPWEEKQAIKNELLGPMSEAMELFPSEMRRMKSITDHQTHLWVFPPGSTIPVGMIPKAIQEMARHEALEKFTVVQDELNLYLVDDKVMQVFGSEDEAKKSYAEAGNVMPSGKVERIDNVPTEDSGAVWSNLAKVKVSSVLEKSAKLDNLMNEEGDLPSEASRVNTNGPDTDQDGLEGEYGVGDYAPNGDEENVMMPEFMKMGVENMQRERKVAIGSAVEKLVVRMEADDKTAGEAAEVEAQAKEDLGKIRAQAVKDGEKKSGGEPTEE